MDTPNLGLPFLMAAQAQKHVTHNEALRALDALVHLAVIDRDATTPPGSPEDGDRYIVAAGGAGAWEGHDLEIAAYQDGAWAFFAPLAGWRSWIGDEQVLVVWDGSAWSSVGGSGGSGGDGDFDTVGINATADTTNRLAVAAAASLFNHSGNGHQQKINKATAGDTASQLYQTGYSGRAEMGLTGDDDFHFKVSPDGSAWNEAILIDKDTGEVSFPSGVDIDNPGLPAGGTTGQVLAKASNDDGDVAWETPAGGGDMLASMYDPNGVEGDAFDMDSMAEGADTKIMTAAERTKLSGTEAAADVTDAGNVGAAINGATGKTTPVDGDTMPLIDSAASNVLKKVTWANVKATLKTYFDTLYQPLLSTLTSWGGITRASGFDTFAATPSSANLRGLLTDETGTGAAVFADSPTLLTPALGTPSAAVLTNATGLPASALVPSTSQAVGFGSVELGHASDTTLARLAAGVVGVEGKAVAFREPTVNPQTGTTYTLVIGDGGNIVSMSNGAANLLTIPPNASVAFPVGTIINVIMLGAGVTSIQGGSGVTLNGVSTGTGAIAARYSGAALLKIATDTWVLSGNVGTVA